MIARYVTPLLAAFALGCLLVMGALYSSGVAVAQENCGDRTTIVKGLASKFLESPVGMGITESNTIVEIFASAEGSFTIIQTEPSGRTCIVASGGDYETMKYVPQRREL